MTAATVVGPEKPPHIDDRINRLSTIDLINAFGAPAGVEDLTSLRHWVGRRQQRPAWPLPEWAAAVRGTAAGAEMIKESAPLLGTVDVTGANEGRSRRYGFHYLQWLRAGVAAWLLTDDHRYLDGFERHLLAWQANRDRVIGEWPGLDVIWYSLGTWARCRNLLPTLEVLTDSALSDQAWAALLSTLIGGARWAYDEHDGFRHGNWQLASASELIHIATVLPDLCEAPSWAERGRLRLDEHLQLDVYPDGGHYERSPGYHTMCLDAVHTATVLDARAGSDRLTESARVAAMHDWLISLADPAGWVPHLQDSGLVWVGTYLLRGGYLLDDPALVGRARAWLGDDQFAIQSAQLPAWSDHDRQRRWHNAITRTRTDSSDQPPPTDSSRIHRLLPESGYAVARSDGRNGAVHLVINYGPHIEHELESHSHRAVLDFILSGQGRPLLWEAGGPPSYDDRDYLGWYQSARGHNTVRVDGQDCAIDRNATCEFFLQAASLSDGSTGPARLSVFAGRHHGYGLQQHRRMIFVRGDLPYLVVFDDASDDGRSHHFEFLLQSPSPWRRSGDGLRWSSRPEDGSGPGVFVAEVGDSPSTSVSHSTGTARLPVTADRSSTYAPLHTLGLTRSTGRFRTVIWPDTAGPTSAPPRVTAGAAGQVVIESAAGRDQVSERQWSRVTSTGWEAYGWQTDRLDDDLGPLINSDQVIDLAIARSADRIKIIVDTTGRCRLLLRGHWSELGMNGIRWPAAPSDASSETAVTLPYPGRWTLTGRASA